MNLKQLFNSSKLVFFSNIITHNCSFYRNSVQRIHFLCEKLGNSLFIMFRLLIDTFGVVVTYSPARKIQMFQWTWSGNLKKNVSICIWQGSILASLWFSLYMLPLSQIMIKKNKVPCSRAPQSWYWRWRERCTFTPPTYNSCRTWDSNSQPFDFDSLTIRPRLPPYH